MKYLNSWIWICTTKIWQQHWMFACIDSVKVWIVFIFSSSDGWIVLAAEERERAKRMNEQTFHRSRRVENAHLLSSTIGSNNEIFYFILNFRNDMALIARITHTSFCWSKKSIFHKMTSMPPTMTLTTTTTTTTKMTTSTVRIATKKIKQINAHKKRVPCVHYRMKGRGRAVNRENENKNDGKTSRYIK